MDCYCIFCISTPANPANGFQNFLKLPSLLLLAFVSVWQAFPRLFRFDFLFTLTYNNLVTQLMIVRFISLFIYWPGLGRMIMPLQKMYNSKYFVSTKRTLWSEGRAGESKFGPLTATLLSSQIRTGGILSNWQLAY